MYVYKKRRGGEYGKMLWVNYGRSACKAGYEFYPNDTGPTGGTARRLLASLALLALLSIDARESKTSAPVLMSMPPSQKNEIGVLVEG